MDIFRWNVINRLLETTKQKRYLEIGVQRGVCGSKVQAAVKIGVDPAPLAQALRHYTAVRRETSDSFFASLPQEAQFDVVLVDGLHHAEQVLRDVDHALEHLAPGGAIVMHDCSPASEIAQRVPREVGVWNGDCWKAMVALRQRSDLLAFTIDSDHGIGVVRRGENPSPIAAPPELSYAALDRDRQQILGLVRPGLWEERYGAPLAIGKVTLVTAIFGGRDTPTILPELDVEEGVLFTDDPGLSAPGWRVVLVPSEGDPRRAARRIKALALDLVEGDIVVWVDGRIALTGAPLRPLLGSALSGADVAGYPHPWRRCAYAEAVECGKLGLAQADALAHQAEAYRAAGFPENRGLFNTMVLARRRTPAMVELGRAWWTEIERHTLRDQVSFPFVLWQAQQRCAALGPDVYATGSSAHFRRGRHGAGAAA
jgi:hypothetical protein